MAALPSSEALPVGLPEPANTQQLYINTKVAEGDCPCLNWFDKPAGQTCSWYTALQRSLMVTASAVPALWADMLTQGCSLVLHLPF